MLNYFPFVRDAKGMNYTIDQLELTYIKGKKLATVSISDPEEWSLEMLEVIKKARKGSVLVFHASITDKFQQVEVIREFYLNK